MLIIVIYDCKLELIIIIYAAEEFKNDWHQMSKILIILNINHK